jgi:hypothetical protein
VNIFSRRREKSEPAQLRMPSSIASGILSSMDVAEKVRENRLRRRLQRRGIRLVKSRRRDRGAVDYAKYAMQETAGGWWGPDGTEFLSLEEIEERLDRADADERHLAYVAEVEREDRAVAWLQSPAGERWLKTSEGEEWLAAHTR